MLKADIPFWNYGYIIVVRINFLRFYFAVAGYAILARMYLLLFILLCNGLLKYTDCIVSILYFKSPKLWGNSTGVDCWPLDWLTGVMQCVRGEDTDLTRPLYQSGHFQLRNSCWLSRGRSRLPPPPRKFSWEFPSGLCLKPAEYRGGGGGLLLHN